MVISLSDDARRLVARFEEEADVAVRDCLVLDAYDLVVFVIEAGEMSDAIGPGGRTVKRVERELGTDVKLVEGADRADAFVANAFAPAAIYNVTISENDDTVAYVEVAEEDRGVAIGQNGRNIDIVRRLAKRHFDVDGVELT